MSRSSASRSIRSAPRSRTPGHCRCTRLPCGGRPAIWRTRSTSSSAGCIATERCRGACGLRRRDRPRVRRALHCRFHRCPNASMAERKRPRRTRERILETALLLFNGVGEPNATTADIADEMEISPGNLYYHFHNKDDIIAELFAGFERRLDGLLISPEGRDAGVEDLWFLLHLLFEAMWDHRFLFRDLD